MNHSQPAFPEIEKNVHGVQSQVHGLTKREFAAIAAMTGICANGDISLAMSQAGMDTASVRKRIAESSIAMADALLTELSKESGK